jgi:glycosyltransferase involved in cell wall biosynthesis
MPASDPVKVLMLVGALPKYPGGGERLAVGLATHLPRDRYEVVFCTTRPGGGVRLVEELRCAGVEHVALRRRHRAELLPWIRLTLMLRRRRFDVLHAHMLGSNVWGSICGRLAGVPAVVAHEHGSPFESKPWRRLLYRLTGRLADTFVAVSARDRERMIAVEGVPAGKIVVMPNAYIPRPTIDGSNVRDELGIAADAPVIGTAAVLRPEKALDVLLDAFTRVGSSRGDAQLVIAGHGRERPGLEEQARALGIAERTHFVGYREDIPEVLRALDVAVISSDSEGSPLLVFECMAHRTPLVSTDVGAVHEVLEDGRSVLLAPTRDAAALAAAIERLLSTPSLRESMVSAAFERLDDFQMSAVAARFGDLYESLLAARTNRPAGVGAADGR